MELTAQKREELGKKSKVLKYSRLMPAVMFGKGLESTPLTVDIVSFTKVFDEVGETGLVDLSFGGTTEKVLIKDVQYDPISSAPIHAGFHKVNLREKIQAQIPVEVVGEEENELVKSGEGLVLVLLNEITVEALPSDLPSEFIVDVSKLLEIDSGITVAELQYDKDKVEIVGVEPDETVVKIDYAQMAEEPEEVEVTEEEAMSQVEATEELTEEEKKAREAEGAKVQEKE